MASLNKLEGEAVEGLLLLLLCVIVLAGFYFGGGQQVAANGIRQVANVVDDFFIWLINLFSRGSHSLADAEGAITGTDTVDTGSSLGSLGDAFDANDLPEDDSQLPDLSQIFG